MYFPFFRGKQNELITIRENAKALAAAAFTPIIEPVKETLGGLERALTAVCEADGTAIVIVNPFHGDHSSSGEVISSLLKEKFLSKKGISAGILLKEDFSVDESLSICDEHKDHPLTLVHAGFLHGRGLADGISALQSVRHVFLEDYCTKLYRRNFSKSQRILVRDGFKRKKNREYPALEPFSDLHITYSDEEGMDGFGDFLTVGDGYSEGGGPAYAIAIHLTFLDPDNDNAMFIYHFKSLRYDTPGDPAGKFAEALDSMITKLDSPQSKVLETFAVKEFRAFHEKKHFPGLGYIKKLSMQHHMETLAHYFAES